MKEIRQYKFTQLEVRDILRGYLGTVPEGWECAVWQEQGNDVFVVLQAKEGDE